jgi:ferredoxin
VSEADKQANPPVQAQAAQGFRVRLEPGGHEIAAPATSTVLQAALHAGVPMPNSCRNGTCRTCMCRLASGHVGYRIAWPGLSADEKEDGYFLPCVAYPQSDLIVDMQGI